ncbi:hypothetical protein [Burkholderia cenocepacia]|uniref:hypothetical protein n=1 Tax=Burkholderia cenocepacia TaxID=95486 RepID=UPI00163B23C5|nr:hypothetical protein [Burkholderia cenocepacia]
MNQTGEGEQTKFGQRSGQAFIAAREESKWQGPCEAALDFDIATPPNATRSI